MTMLHEPHPDDERIAAFADADPDALADDALATHAAACERCAAVVADLRSLRVALSGLPDLAPPRSLQLVPPVAATRQPEPSGWAAMLRRLTAPAMALAVVLILVGAVGSTGSLLRSASTGAGGSTGRMAEEQQMAAPSAAASIGDAGREFASSPTPTAVAPKVPTNDGTTSLGALDRGTGSPGGLPYGWFLGAGVILLAGAFLVRASTLRSDGLRRGP
jgi:hypothetical protein